MGDGRRNISPPEKNLAFFFPFEQPVCVRKVFADMKKHFSEVNGELKCGIIWDCMLEFNNLEVSNLRRKNYRDVMS